MSTTAFKHVSYNDFTVYKPEQQICLEKKMQGIPSITQILPFSDLRNNR